MEDVYATCLCTFGGDPMLARNVPLPKKTHGAPTSLSTQARQQQNNLPTATHSILIHSLEIPLLSLWRTARRGTDMRARRTNSEPMLAVNRLRELSRQQHQVMAHLRHHTEQHRRDMELRRLVMGCQRPRATDSQHRKIPMLSTSSLVR